MDQLYDVFDDDVPLGVIVASSEAEAEVRAAVIFGEEDLRIVPSGVLAVQEDR